MAVARCGCGSRLERISCREHVTNGRGSEESRRSTKFEGHHLEKKGTFGWSHSEVGWTAENSHRRTNRREERQRGKRMAMFDCNYIREGRKYTTLNTLKELARDRRRWRAIVLAADLLQGRPPEKKETMTPHPTHTYLIITHGLHPYQML